jgi:hypothetical protein
LNYKEEEQQRGTKSNSTPAQFASLFVVGSGDAKAGDGVTKIVFVGVGLGVGIRASFGPPSLLKIITETTPMLPRFE